MKNFISPIYIKTNSITDERICIGLFVSNNEKSYFSWSENKLKIISKISSEDVYESLHNSFTSLSKDINFSSSEGFQKRIFDSNLYSAEYFKYLSNYNKGLIEFKEPKIISNDINDAEFAELFMIYVGESIPSLVEKKVKETLVKHVNTILKRPIFKERTNVNYKIDETLVGTIYRPLKVDFISCNGSVFAGQVVDFTSGPATIENKLYEFRALSEGLMNFAKHRKLDGDGKYEIFFNEPEEKEQKSILDNARKDRTSPFKLKELDKLEDVTKTLERKNYKKFSEII